MSKTTRIATFEKTDSILANPRIKFRHIICGLVTSALTIMLSNTHVYNFTIICMNKDNTSTSDVSYEYTKRETDLLLSSGYIGPFVALIPIYYFANAFGMRISFGICGLVSFAATILSPWAADQGFWAFWTMRLLQGIATAIIGPSIGVVTSHWSTIAGNGLFVSILAAHYQLAPLLTMPLSAVMCETMGWQWVYYIQGIMTFVLFLLFIVLYTDKPADNKFLSRYELRQIEKDKSHEEKHVEKAKTPYFAICTTWSIWGVWVSSIGGTLGFSIFLQYGPTYLNKVLHYSIATTGWSVAFPYIFSFFARVFAQPLTADCKFLGEKYAAIVSTTLSQGTMAVAFIILVFIPVTWTTLAEICYGLVIVANGLNGVGITRSAQLVSKQYLSFVYTGRAFFVGLVSILLPLMVNIIAPEDTHKQWTQLFLIIFVIVLTSNIFFCIVADVKPAPWTKGTVEVDEREPDNEEPDKDSRV